MNFNPLDFKKQFPIFNTPELKTLAYFDNAATTQKPNCVIQAITHFYITSNANTHRASHKLAQKATQALEDTRQQLAHYINANRNEVIFCRGATEGINLIASIIQEQCNPNDEIILSSAEHHANLLPWQRLATLKQMKIQYLPHHNGVPDLTALPNLITAKTKIISITLASNVLGCRLPIEQYKTILEMSPAYVIIDAAQALAHEQINITALGCDFLVGSAHKMYGPTGVGFVFGRYEILVDLPPYHVGGDMIESVTATTATYTLPPHRFEAGTLPLANIIGFGAALHFLQQLNRQAVASHEQALILHLHKALSIIPEVHLLTTADNNIGIVSFTIKTIMNANVTDLAHWLNEHNIAVRVGYHCAQPLYQALQLTQSLRISIAPYNTEQDCHRLLSAIQQWMNQLRHPTAISSPHSSPHNNRNHDKHHISPVTKSHHQFEYFDIQDIKQQPSWQKRYAQLMRWGNIVQKKPEIHHDRYKIKGCESNTWMTHKVLDTIHYFSIDSESRIIRGLSALLLCWIQGKTTKHIQSIHWATEMKKLGLSQHFSESRSNGFQALLNEVTRSIDNNTTAQQHTIPQQTLH